MNPQRTALVLIRRQNDYFAPGGALEDLAEHGLLRDYLTGVARRPLLHDDLHQTLDRVTLHGCTAAVLAIDIDLFPNVNDRFGGDTGDRVLIEVGRRLRAALRSSDSVSGPDIVACIDVDVFFVVCEDMNGERAAAAIAARLAEAISSPIELDGQTVTVTVGIGIVHGTASHDSEAVVRDAEDALR